MGTNPYLDEKTERALTTGPEELDPLKPVTEDGGVCSAKVFMNLAEGKAGAIVSCHLTEIQHMNVHSATGSHPGLHGRKFVIKNGKLQGTGEATEVLITYRWPGKYLAKQ